MSVTEKLQPLLDREMSRKEFLWALGFGIVSIFGVSTIIRLLSGKSVETHLQQKVGFGATPYGGKR